MVDNNTKKTGQSHYNLNETDFLLLADLQREAFQLRNVKKNYIASFERWRSIRMLIDARFDDKETKILDEIEESFWKPQEIQVPDKLSGISSFGNKSPKKTYIIKIIRSRKLKVLDEYITQIRALMKLHKIAMTDLETKAMLE